MLRTLVLVGFAAILALVAACGEKSKTDESGEVAEGQAAEETVAEAPAPDYIAVQHILIAFQGSIPGKPVTRTKEEAQQLANELLGRAQKGEDFDALVREYTDDAAPGIYRMANDGAQADMSQGIFPRRQMVGAFGDVGFALQVGDIGIAEYNPQTSPYGWHVIKRVE